VEMSDHESLGDQFAFSVNLLSRRASSLFTYPFNTPSGDGDVADPS